MKAIVCKTKSNTSGRLIMVAEFLISFGASAAILRRAHLVNDWTITNRTAITNVSVVLSMFIGRIYERRIMFANTHRHSPSAATNL